jgi:dTDP-4-dehydrorhamnose reductase
MLGSTIKTFTRLITGAKKIYGVKSEASSPSHYRDMAHILWNAEVQYDVYISFCTGAISLRFSERYL